jgi:hypothetical protein
MGGADICDQLLEAYRTFLKTNKWTLKIIIHFIVLASANVCLEYKEDCRKSQIPKNIVDLLGFNMVTAEIMVASIKGGRCQPSGDKNNEQQSKTCHPSAAPYDDKRLDGFGHWPVFHILNSAWICKWKGCLSRIRVISSKCNIYLCLITNSYCFTLHHTKK